MEDTLKQQRIRMFRVATLATGVMIHLTVCWLATWFGVIQIDERLLLGISLFVLAGYALMELFILMEWNLGFEHPDMALVQLVWAMAIVVLTSQFFNELKPLVMMFGLAMIVIGVARLNKRELPVFVACGLAIYSATIVYHLQAGTFDLAVEIVTLIVIGMTMICGPVLGRLEAGVIEESLVDSNEALRESLRRVQDLETIDQRSGAANKRRLLEVLNQQKALADRYGYDFSVCLLDLNPFKRVFDGEDSFAADNMLREFVARLRAEMRQVDCLGRLDGEKFVVVLSGANEQHATLAAGRIMAQLSRTQTNLGPGINLSMGITGYRSGETIKTMMERADKILYNARRTTESRALGREDETDARPEAL